MLFKEPYKIARHLPCNLWMPVVPKQCPSCNVSFILPSSAPAGLAQC